VFNFLTVYFVIAPPKSAKNNSFGTVFERM
jgi:hypothetical protein